MLTSSARTWCHHVTGMKSASPGERVDLAPREVGELGERLEVGRKDVDRAVNAVVHPAQ